MCLHHPLHLHALPHAAAGHAQGPLHAHRPLLQQLVPQQLLTNPRGHKSLRFTLPTWVGHSVLGKIARSPHRGQVFGPAHAWPHRPLHGIHGYLHGHTLHAPKPWHPLHLVAWETGAGEGGSGPDLHGILDIHGPPQLGAHPRGPLIPWLAVVGGRRPPHHHAPHAHHVLQRAAPVQPNLLLLPPFLLVVLFLQLAPGHLLGGQAVLAQPLHHHVHLPYVPPRGVPRHVMLQRGAPEALRLRNHGLQGLLILLQPAGRGRGRLLGSGRGWCWWSPLARSSGGPLEEGLSLPAAEQQPLNVSKRLEGALPVLQLLLGQAL